MTEKINLDGKDYLMDEMSDAQKYLISLVQEQQLKISEARKNIDIATAANKTLIEELKKSLAEEKSETKKIAEG